MTLFKGNNSVGIGVLLKDMQRNVVAALSESASKGVNSEAAKALVAWEGHNNLCQRHCSTGNYC